jgi:hypothetical protein
MQILLPQDVQHLHLQIENPVRNQMVMTLEDGHMRGLESEMNASEL